MKSYRGIAQVCRSCGRKNDAHGDPDLLRARPPQPGDFSVCGYCRIVSVFGEGLKLRPPDAKEIALIEGENAGTIRHVTALCEEIFFEH